MGLCLTQSYSCDLKNKQVCGPTRQALAQKVLQAAAILQSHRRGRGGLLQQACTGDFPRSMSRQSDLGTRGPECQRRLIGPPDTPHTGKGCFGVLIWPERLAHLAQSPHCRVPSKTADGVCNRLKALVSLPQDGSVNKLQAVPRISPRESLASVPGCR